MANKKEYGFLETSAWPFLETDYEIKIISDIYSQSNLTEYLLLNISVARELFFLLFCLGLLKSNWLAIRKSRMGQ